MTFVILALIITVLMFGFVLLFGAPYLPTLNKQAITALDILGLKKGQHLLELGSGDGKVVLLAAQRGLRVTGYELNPILVLVSRIRTWKYRGQVQIIWGNFWAGTLPEAEGIFVFLLPKYMKRLDNKIVQEFRKPVKLISFAFKIPDKKPRAVKDGLFHYIYK